MKAAPVTPKHDAKPETAIAVVRHLNGWALRTFILQGERVVSVTTSEPDLRHIICGRAQDIHEDGE